jgi:hypothetical protein
MSVAIMVDTPGMTAEQYDATIDEIGLRGSLPAGCSAHIAGASPDGGWRVITVWDDADTARAFVTSTVRPAQEKAGVTPAGGPPVVWEVHNAMF